MEWPIFMPPNQRSRPSTNLWTSKPMPTRIMLFQIEWFVNSVATAALYRLKMSLMPSMSKVNVKRSVWSRGLLLAVAMT